MLIIIASAQFFQEDIKKIALKHNKITGLVEYKVDDKYSIDIPKGWGINENSEKDEGVIFSLDFNDNNIINGKLIIKNYITLASLRNSIVDNKVIIKEYHRTYNDEEWSVVQWQSGKGLITTCYYSGGLGGKAVSVSFEEPSGNLQEGMELVFESIILGVKYN